MSVLPSLQRMSVATSALNHAAAGGFQVSGNGVDGLIKATESLEKELNRARARTNQLAHEPPIGTTPAAEVYRPHFAATVTDPHQGVLAAIDQMLEDIAAIRQNLVKSRAEYEATEERNTQGQKTIDNTLSA